MLPCPTKVPKLTAIWHIDKTWRGGQPSGVDRQFGSCAVKNANGRYGVTPYTNVALVPGISRSVDDTRMANDDIESLCLEKEA